MRKRRSRGGLLLTWFLGGHNAGQNYLRSAVRRLLNPGKLSLKWEAGQVIDKKNDSSDAHARPCPQVICAINHQIQASSRHVQTAKKHDAVAAQYSRSR